MYFTYYNLKYFGLIFFPLNLLAKKFKEKTANMKKKKIKKLF